MISTEDKNHVAIMGRVNDFLAANDFSTSEKTYHDGHLPKEVVQMMRRNFSPTALFVRASADRLATHPSGCVFYYEGKTSTHSSGNLAIEAIPLIHHMRHAETGINCLYCCCANDGSDHGFWAHNIPILARAFLPIGRWSEDLMSWFRRMIGRSFPDLEILEMKVAGTGDPFVIIDSYVLNDLPSWMDLINQEKSEWSSRMFDRPSEAQDEAEL